MWCAGGAVVNIAARIENLGHGGQILVSEEAMQAGLVMTTGHLRVGGWGLWMGGLPRHIGGLTPCPPRREGTLVTLCGANANVRGQGTLTLTVTLTRDGSYNLKAAHCLRWIPRLVTSERGHLTRAISIRK